MYVGNDGVGWGFRIVPEPGSFVIMGFGAVAMVFIAIRRRRAAYPAQRIRESHVRTPPWAARLGAVFCFRGIFHLG
jgi:hypothetical protein